MRNWQQRSRLISSWNTGYNEYALVPQYVLQPQQKKKADEVMKYNPVEWTDFIVT